MEPAANLYLHDERRTGSSAKSYRVPGADISVPDVQETPPTSDQLSSILEYLGPSKAGMVIKDATGITDALRKFKANESSFQRPLVVDWHNARAGVF